MKRLVIGLIRLYQLTLSRVIPARCRFYPSCSHYAIESIQRFGFTRGVAKSARRLSRCHPFNAGGLDPVTGGLHASH